MTVNQQENSSPGTTKMLLAALGGAQITDSAPTDVGANVDPQTPLMSEATIPARTLPAVVGGYRIIRRIGSGGMAEVFEATHLGLKRQVALKVLRPTATDNADFVRRFLREARTMAQIRHPHVVAIHEAGTVDGCLFMAQELLVGGDLAHLLARRGQLDIDQALDLMIDCADGLEAIHAAGLVHRDIKPANILLDRQGQPKLGDLGLARGVAVDERLTVNGACWGTPGYMSPEQIVGAIDLDIRCDIYALGATLYTLLVGSEPFVGETSYIITFKTMTEPVPDPRAFNRMIPAAVVELIHRAMDKDRDQRFQTPRAMREALVRARNPHQQTPSGNRDGTKMPPTAKIIDQFGSRAQQERIPITRTKKRLGAPVVRFAITTVVFTGLSTAMAGTYWSLSSDQVERTIEASAAPTWASTWGTDHLGSWAELTVAGLTRRLRYVPPAQFRMGGELGEAERQVWENPHQATITTGFWMLASECDQELYRSISGTNPSHQRGDDLPVDSLRRAEAEEFCAELNRRGIPARLPTEAQWEYACRAGQSGPFSGSESAEKLGWMASGSRLAAWNGAIASAQTRSAAVLQYVDQHADEVGVGARAVARLRPNGFGLYDMHGNVYEWCADAWDGHSPYPEKPMSDPQAVTGELAIIRGGSWFVPASQARSAARAGCDPNAALPDVGFRFLVPQK